MKKLFLFLMPVFFLVLVNIPVQAGLYELAAEPVELDASKCFYKIDIWIDPEEKQSNSADLIINYNPAAVLLVDADNLHDGTQLPTGNAYESYVYNHADNTAGEAKITGVTFNALDKRKIFASLLFVAKSQTINFEFKFEGVGNTIDSNIAELTTNHDILSAVKSNPVEVKNYQCDLNESDLNKLEYIPVADSENENPIDTAGSKDLLSNLNSSSILLLGFCCICLVLLLILVIIYLFKKLRDQEDKDDDRRE